MEGGGGETLEDSGELDVKRLARNGCLLAIMLTLISAILALLVEAFRVLTFGIGSLTRPGAGPPTPTDWLSSMLPYGAGCLILAGGLIWLVVSLYRR